MGVEVDESRAHDQSGGVEFGPTFGYRVLCYSVVYGLVRGDAQYPIVCDRHIGSSVQTRGRIEDMTASHC
jgi:hypothetical protein